MSSTLLKRLDLTKGDKWDSMLQGVTDVEELPDPTGIAIFEARPEVVVNIATLAIKSDHMIEDRRPLHSNPGNSNRAEVSSLLQLDQYIDLVIPRGSNSLVRNIQNNTRIPVMGHADGLCSVYIDASADPKKAVRIAVDSKIDYPAACNAAETLILHETVLNTIWPEVARALLAADVKLLCDEPSLAALRALSPAPANLASHVQPSTAESYTTEHLGLTLSVKTLPSLPDAIRWMSAHSSQHTDAIVAEDERAAATFCRGVDSAGTFVNASTRFADGFRYGFGTEVGISTGRIHARGPVGLEGLVTYKYMMRSKGEQGHIVGEFGAGAGKKKYKHRQFATTTVPF
ncbi:Aldehyde/histidinol dehydrogenase [Trametes elegans]|nr:Aldehyde/histidinol dehydrogenase [Trametes elegans]